MPDGRLSRRTAVVGVGTTAYGKLPEHDAYDLGVWALREALDDERILHRYDPIFYDPPLGATFAELSSEAKQAVSHRGQAMARVTGGAGSSQACGRLGGSVLPFIRPHE